MTNTYQMIARADKCDKLVAVLREQNITAANVREVMENEEFWQAASHSAGCKPPSKVTRQMVLESLEREI